MVMVVPKDPGFTEPGDQEGAAFCVPPLRVQHVPVIRYVYSIRDSVRIIQDQVRKISAIIFLKGQKRPAEQMLHGADVWPFFASSGESLPERVITLVWL